MRKTTRIDLHSHTRGSDGVSSPEEIAREAEFAGLNALALTDHHSNETYEVQEVADALERRGILPIIGCEYTTKENHLLIYGISVPRYGWGEYPAMQDVVDEVNAMGGACVVPHPYKGFSRTIGDGVHLIRGLAAIETLNGKVELKHPEHNERAKAAAARMGLPQTGASDAHCAEDIGIAYTEFSGVISNQGDFLEALRSGRFRPRSHTHRLAFCKQRREAARVKWLDRWPAAASYADSVSLLPSGPEDDLSLWRKS